MSPTAQPPPAPTDFEFGPLLWAQRYRAAILAEFAPVLRGRVLEEGAGIGHFTSHLVKLPQVNELLAVEPNPRLCAEFRRRHPQVRLVEGTLETLRTDPAWDAVVSVNVLEHIADDQAHLAVYRQLVNPRQGHLCLFVPARPELYAPLDRQFGHYRRYTRPDLSGKLQQAGWAVVRLHYFNWLGYFTWAVLFRLLKRRQFNPALVRLFDQLLFPLVYGLERHVIRPPFGQSLIAIARPS